MSATTPTATRDAIGPAGKHWAWLALAVGVAFAPHARAQHTDLWVPPRGHGTVSAAYQHLYVRYHTDSNGNKGMPGTMRLRSVFTNVDYGLTDRLALNASVVFKSNKYDARIPGSAHDPGSLEDSHGEHLLDDGHYHGGWQDWNVALRYLWIDKPHLVVTPFVDVGQPIRDYTVFAHAAVGTGQRQLEGGVNVGGRAKGAAANLFWRVGAAYAYMEEAGDRRVNHATFDAELGYFVTPRLTVRGIIVKRKTYNGLDLQDYTSHTDDLYFHHDQNIRDDFLNIGASVEYQLNERYSGFVNFGHSLRGDNTHLIKYAITIGISRGF